MVLRLVMSGFGPGMRVKRHFLSLRMIFHWRRCFFRNGFRLMHRLGVESTARASFYFYNTKAEVDRFVEVVKEIQKFFAT